MPQIRRRPSKRTRPRLKDLPAIWASHHLQGALASLGRLIRSPLATLMTIAVMAIALALPGGLFLLTYNLDKLSGNWEQTASISVFLSTEVSMADAEALALRMRGRPELADVRIISPEQALEELRAQSGFAEAVEQLAENPLPVVLALRPAPHVHAPEDLEALRDGLRSLPGADFVRLDAHWIRRFRGLVAVAERGVLLLGGLLSLGVLLMVGNTIRLEIENRRVEIEVMELVGATSGFIRRPFLYTGAWYGLLGGIGAWLLIAIALASLQGPVSRLAELYQTRFVLSGLGLGGLVVLLAGSISLGLLGSWLSVSRHLAATEPE